ncbi:unnamed protein product [Citrullus colocynthis]|uniref:Uncharacterized protein n=1 Tax=Citrullus colocynthis TaxID=252529 RepID=A0ABP0XTQ1_9ROSI
MEHKIHSCGWHLSDEPKEDKTPSKLLRQETDNVASRSIASSNVRQTDTTHLPTRGKQMRHISVTGQADLAHLQRMESRSNAGRANPARDELTAWGSG